MGQSITSGREGWGLSLEPSLAPSSSLRQGKGRWYLLLGLSWAQALGVRGGGGGALPGALDSQGSCARSGTTPGEKTVVGKRMTSASSCTSTTSPGCLSATLLQVRWVMPLPGAAPRPEEGEGGLGGAL